MEISKDAAKRFSGFRFQRTLRIGSVDGEFKGRCEKVQWMGGSKDAADRFSGCGFQRTLRIGSVDGDFKGRCE
jgi:hypothetical protein